MSRQISIHALRVEGDACFQLPVKTPFTFLSTPSGWRATSPLFGLSFIDPISIHALRVEGDLQCEIKKIFGADFYPRPPGGGRLKEIKEEAE